MEDGACGDVELACGLVIWPARREKLKKGAWYIAVINVHLSATEDEALLRRWNTRLLLDFLLDPSDLQ
jgi:hypothetical protein